jgi:phosphoglycolate phosphatase-like HAD superfamily hydrolase
MKTFNQYIFEKEMPEIYCDMDEVLCNFTGGYTTAFNKDFASTDKEERWEDIKSKKDFWHTLPWMSGSEKMWKMLNKYNANILSAYSKRDSNSQKGKRAWISKNLRLNGKIHLVQREDKQKFATTNDKPNILIDDYPKNIKEWEAKGGIGIRHINPAKTMRELEKLLR